LNRTAACVAAFCRRETCEVTQKKDSGAFLKFGSWAAFKEDVPTKAFCLKKPFKKERNHEFSEQP
jgi:hypothetical protein